MGLDRKTILNITLLIFCLFLFFFPANLFLQIFPDNQTPPRFLIWSHPTFEVDSYGAVTLAKNDSVREVAVYNDKIEYDMFYKTNNFGSPDNLDYKNNDTAVRSYAFVGDSFAAGAGGYEWISELRDKLAATRKDIALYNFSLPGGGFFHFKKMLESASHKLHFTDIVICAITDDFCRRYWKPLTRDGKMYFYAGALCSRAVAAIIEPDTSQAEIIRRVKKSESASLQGEATGGVKRFPKESVLFYWIHQARLWLQHKKRTNPPIGFYPLETIRALFPKARIYFFHLPQKNEAEMKAYEVDFQKHIESLGISYIPALYEYPWDKSMFYENDGHPNRYGYRQIAKYVEQWLLSNDKR